ncbi:metal ABC transporter permease [Corynebacterium heidelbergense]|uniref:Metal ABC transporter permease n=1 Tax=Corynebacterium heidelbergense TaxID=2055947 RepID=A0A364V443_9CORY|nr:metal ABC transporter permease [Corynebacterium heidelbergense]RAV31403.1 hypothetical protein DLJ54_08525 [Corynebacterium heidelbergense]
MSWVEHVVIAPFSYDFMQRAAIVGVFTAVVAGVLSCWLVLVGWSLLGDAVSHAVLPGVVVAYALGLPLAVGALVAAVLAVGLVGSVRERTTLREDAGIGVVFTGLFALGLVLLTVLPRGPHLNELLFGSVLGITQAALWQTLCCGAVALVALLLCRRVLTWWAFDATHARASGVNTTAVRWVLLGSLALVVVASVQAVGVILVVAMLITPGATAYLCTRRFHRMLLLAPLLAGGSALAGLLLSYHTNVSSGGAIVLAQSALFAVAFGVARLRGKPRG